ncbi:MAG: hypothetical protein J6S04_02445, partial [Clostridia bacterium]|nr:hypothetical protein [Clostridia bacterium]
SLEGDMGGGLMGDLEMEFDVFQQPIELKIKPLDVQVPYDANNPTVYAVNRLDEYFLKKYLDLGYYYEVEVVGQQTGIGTSKSEIVDGSFKMYDRFGNDITHLFIVKMDTGVVSVYGDFYVDIYEMIFTYDGKSHTYTEYDEFGFEWYKVYCPEGYEILFDASSLSLKDYGTLNMYQFTSIPVTVKYNGVVLEDAPEVVFIGNSLRINQRSVVFVAGSSSDVYEEDFVLTNEEITLQKGTLAFGHTFEGKTAGELDEVGEEYNAIIDIVIYDEHGVDVTGNYSIDVVLGKLELVE